MLKRISPRRWALSTIACVAVLAMTTSSAFAQFGGGGGFRDVANPEIDSEQIEQIGDMVAFTDDQYEFANELLQSYLAEIKVLGEKVRAITDGARQEFRETRDQSVWQDVMGAMAPLGEEKDKIGERFMEDLRLILDADQDEQWEEVERFHRRYTSFSDDGLLSGETVDVIAAVRDMELPEETMEGLKPILEQYSIEVDRALLARNKTYESAMSKGIEMFRSGDMDKMQDLYEDARDEATRVRDINRRYAKQVETVLEASYAAEFNREFKERSFPRVYRPSITGRAITASMEFEDLSPEQLDQIEMIRDDYRTRENAFNDKIAKTIEDGEMSRGVESMFGRGRGRGGESQEIRDVRAEKRDLDEATMARLRALLTDEQAARLPEREDNSDWRERLPNRGGDGNRRGGDRGNRPRTL